ncbi:wd40 repeat-like protein [Anaeramoeba ignava]|uniref:Wd40 repeat-like protein n=1 Tax=Anaeramoeba ignava TaxID=1746090 RepID=A0A9Q0L917_ANAIG|nr:wd40 repeat-like protein [Anaeramoeba ignava]
MESLKIGFIFWNFHNIKNQHITSILTSSNQKYVVTGSKSGSICIWETGKKPKNKNNFIPKIVLLGHKSEITSMTNIAYTVTPSFATVSIDGTLCIWGYKDGICYSYVENAFSCVPMIMIFDEINNTLIVGGEKNLIEIFDLESMKIIQGLQGQGCWTSDLAISFSENSIFSNNILLSLGMDGTIHFWKLNNFKHFAYKDSQSLSTDPHLFEAKLPKNEIYNSFSLSPNQTLILVFSNSHYHIFDSTATKELFSENIENMFPNSKGFFIDNSHFMIWSSSSQKIGIFEMNFTRPIPQKPQVINLINKNTVTKDPKQSENLAEQKINESIQEFGEKNNSNNSNTTNTNITNSDQSENKISNLTSSEIDDTIRSIRESEQETYLETSTDENPLEKPFAILSIKKTNILDMNQNNQNNQFVMNKSRPFMNSNNFGFICGNSEGDIYFWNKNEVLDFSENSIQHQAIPKISSLKKGWKSKSKSNSKSNNITSSFVCIGANEIDPFVIYGYENGEISIHNMFSKEKEKEKDKEKKLIGHSKEITALLVPKSQPDMLVSASRDLTIRIWIISFQQQIAIYKLKNQAVTILSDEFLFQDSTKCFYAISEDRTIFYIYSLDEQVMKATLEHPSQINRIFFKNDLPNLVIECKEKLIYFWNISTGENESIISGPQAISKMKKIEKQFSQFHIFEIQKSIEQEKSKSEIYINTFSLKNTLLPSSYGFAVDISKICHKLENFKFNDENKETKTLFQFLSFLIPKEYSQELLKKLEKFVGIRNSKYANGSFCVFGNSGTVTILTPKMQKKFTKWNVSSVTTAIVILSSVSIGNVLLGIPNPHLQDIGSEIIANYCEIIPMNNKKYKNPSIHFLCHFWRISEEETRQSAEAIIGHFFGKEKNFSNQKKILSMGVTNSKKNFSMGVINSKNYFSAGVIHSHFNLLIRDQRLGCFLILAYIGSVQLHLLERSIAKRIIFILLDFLEQNDIRGILALRVLGRGFLTWKRYFPDPSQIIRHIIFLASQGEDKIQKEAKRALNSIAKENPLFFLEAFTKEFTRKESTWSYKYLLLALIANAIKGDVSIIFLPHLFELIKLFVLFFFSLEKENIKNFPQNPTKEFSQIMTQFPMADYNYDVFLVCLGNQMGKIVTFDLNQKIIPIFEAHSQAISALKLNPKGTMLASFSYSENTLKIWTLRFSSFRSQRVKAKCKKTIKVDRNLIKIEDGELESISVFWNVSLDWDSHNSVNLLWKHKSVLNVRI